VLLANCQYWKWTTHAARPLRADRPQISLPVTRRDGRGGLNGKSLIYSPIYWKPVRPPRSFHSRACLVLSSTYPDEVTKPRPDEVAYPCEANCSTKLVRTRTTRTPSLKEENGID
jgi:hypothetical protein